MNDIKRSPLRNGVVFSKDEKIEKEKQKTRIDKLSPYKVSRLVSNLRILDYCVEAESNFIYGCFRSCIICSAVAVELALEDSLIFSSEDWEETYWEIKLNRKLGFWEILDRLRKKGKLVSVLEDAKWLKEARNQIVAHPLYIGTAFEMKKPGHGEGKSFEHLIWATRTMLRDIRKLLRFVGPDMRKTIEERSLTTEDDKGRILEEFLVKDFLNLERRGRYDRSDWLYWKVIQNELIEEIAFLAYTKMVRIINTIFPEEKGARHP